MLKTIVTNIRRVCNIFWIFLLLIDMPKKVFIIYFEVKIHMSKKIFLGGF